MADYNNIIGSTGDVAQILENDSDELVAFIPRAEEMAEQRIANELPALAFNKVDPGVLVPGTNTIARPSDITTLRYLIVYNTTDAEWQPVEFKAPEMLRATYPDDQTVAKRGQPVFYAVDDPAYFLLGPVPDAALAYKLGYRHPLTALSVGSPTNWLTANAYSLLLIATVTECVRFVIDDRAGGLMEMYEKKYAELLAFYIMREKRNMRDEYRPRDFDQSNSAGMQGPGG